jgi:hypothetical protein
MGPVHRTNPGRCRRPGFSFSPQAEQDISERKILAPSARDDAVYLYLWLVIEEIFS